MNRVRIKQKDRYSIELKLQYPIDRSGGSNNRHSLQIHFVLPRTLGIAPATYERRRFLDQLTVLLRFGTPSMTLEEVLNGDRDRSPLVRLERGTEVMRDYKVIHEARMLGCVYKSLLRDRIAVADTDPPTPDEITRLREVPVRFRAARVNHEGKREADRVREALDTIDEHLSLLFGRYLTMYLCRGVPIDAESRRVIARLLEAETEYRRERGFASAPEPDWEQSRFEYFVHHEKQLKEYATGALRVDVYRSDTARRTEQILYAIAAGIAMAIATAVLLLGRPQLEHIGIALFALLVATYMLKDRVKDLIREVLTRRIGRYFSIRKQTIREPRRHTRLGTLVERVGFRETQTRSKGVGPAPTLVYSKQIRLNGVAIARLHRRIESIVDINTIDLRPFLDHLTAQWEVVPVVRGEEVRPKPVKRVHHIELLVRDGESNQSPPLRYRLVVDSRGLRRIDDPEKSGTVAPGTWSIARAIRLSEEDEE